MKLIPFQEFAKAHKYIDNYKKNQGRNQKIKEFAKAPGYNRNQGRSLHGKTAAKGEKQATINPPFKSKYVILNTFHYFSKYTL